MIDQAILNATLANLSAAAANIITALPNAQNSTPDTAVQAFVDGVGAVTTTLVSVLNPPTPIPTAPSPA